MGGVKLMGKPYVYSRASCEKLDTCDGSLQLIFERAIKIVDIQILAGFRDEPEQRKAFLEGYSTVDWPDSRHNKFPSEAVDAAMYPVLLRGEMASRRAYFLAGVVHAIAEELGIGIRWGGDWDGDKDFADQRFDDLFHFELA